MATFYDSKLLFNGTLAAGGVDTIGEWAAINGYTEFTPIIQYTRGGVGGAVTIRVDIANENNPTSVYYQIGESQAAAIVPGTDATINVQRANIVYTATGATMESVTLPTFTCVGQFMRVRGAESGAIGTPGNLQLTVNMRGNQT